MQKPRQNGTTDGSTSGQGPRDELDVAAEFVSSSGYEDLLRELNLGTGNYSTEDLQMQMRSFRKGMVAAVAFDGRLFDRAVYETKVKLADEGYQYRDEDGSVLEIPAFDDLEDTEDVAAEHGGRGPALQHRGEKLWSRLSEPGAALSDAQAAALSQKVGIERFKPVFWRLMAVYHEGSKSRHARTQDNFFGRVKKHLVDDTSESDLGRSFFNRGGETR